MSESTWYKWLAISTLLHFICVGVFSITLPKSSRRIDLSAAYSVSLVGDLGGGPKGSGGVGAHISEAKPAPAKAKPAPAKEKPTKKEKIPPVKEKPAKVKPVPVKPEKEVSLSKKKVPVKEAPKAEKKETPTKEELDALNRRLREIKRKTDYLDVAKKGSESAVTRALGGGSGSGNLAFSGEGGGGGKPLDLPTQKYIMDVWEKVKEAWGLPGPSFKKLETEVTIKIRKDGRIIDISMDKRSGNRLYDESILRALRSVDPLPPIPPSINQETIEIPFRFRPGEMS